MQSPSTSLPLLGSGRRLLSVLFGGWSGMDFGHVSLRTCFLLRRAFPFCSRDRAASRNRLDYVGLFWLAANCVQWRCGPFLTRAMPAPCRSRTGTRTKPTAAPKNSRHPRTRGRIYGRTHFRILGLPPIRKPSSRRFGLPPARALALGGGGSLAGSPE